MQQGELFPEVRPVPTAKQAAKNPTHTKKQINKETGEVKELKYTYEMGFESEESKRLRPTLLCPMPTSPTPFEWFAMFNRLGFWARGAENSINDLANAYLVLQEKYHESLRLCEQAMMKADAAEHKCEQILKTIDQLAQEEN